MLMAVSVPSYWLPIVFPGTKQLQSPIPTRTLRTQVQSTEGGGDALASDAGHSTSAASVASYDGHTSSVETMPVQQHHHDHSYDHGHDSYDATEYEQEHQEAGPWITLFDPDSQVSQPVSQSVS